MNRAYLIVLFLFLSTTLCVADEDFMIQSDEEENLAIYLSSDEPREIFDPFDLLNYDRQKMLEQTKKKAVRGIVDSNIDPFDPLNLNQKRFLKGKIPIGSEVDQKMEENDDKLQDVVDGSSVLANQNFVTNEKMSEDEVSEKETEQETLNSNIEQKCKCETELQMCDDPIEARERPILRRFVQSLYSTLSLENAHITDGDVLHFTLSAKISQRARGILHDIVSTDGDIKKKKLADLDEILFDLFKLETSQPNEGLPASLIEIINIFNLHPKDWILFLFVSFLCIISAILIQRRSIFAVCATFGILLFCVSWYWSWHHLYQQSLSKRQSDAIKYSEMPASCKPAQLSSFAAAIVWLSNLLPGEDPCQKYHEILMTDPIYQVTPIMALSDTLATAIFHPLGYIGRQIGQFFNGVLEESSWYTKIPVFGCVVFLLVTLLGFVCGYEIHLPFMMGSLKPARHKKTRTLDSINAPQVEAIASISEQRSHGTPPQPIMVVVNVVTDAMGDSKVQKIIERAIDPAPLPSLTSEQALSELTMKTVPSLEFSNSDTKNIASDIIDETSENSTELEFDDAAETADKNDASSSRNED